MPDIEPVIYNCKELDFVNILVDIPAPEPEPQPGSSGSGNNSQSGGSSGGGGTGPTYTHIRYYLEGDYPSTISLPDKDKGLVTGVAPTLFEIYNPPGTVKGILVDGSDAMAKLRPPPFTWNFKVCHEFSVSGGPTLSIGNKNAEPSTVVLSADVTFIVENNNDLFGALFFKYWLRTEYTTYKSGFVYHHNIEIEGKKYYYDKWDIVVIKKFPEIDPRIIEYLKNMPE